MKNYLQFVWESLTHPHDLIDLLAPMQLLLAIVCWYFIIRAFIQIYKDKQHGKK